MKRRILSGLLALGILIGLVAMPAAATTADSDTIQAAVAALGIITGDQNGNLNLSQTVTRAEFAKMLVAASVYKDTVSGGSGVSPYRDVKSTHWAADYVSIAASAGWMTGYVDGSFRPDQSIPYEEAASAILKLLGYTAADLMGTYPQAQLSKFVALKLSSGLSLVQGRALTRNECMVIFYNLMGATNREGKLYGTTLGYTLDANGKLDYDALLKSTLEGPFVLGEGALSALVPFDLGSATVYRNGKLSNPDLIGRYDVVYYHKQNSTVWAYSNRVIGLFTALSPSSTSPETVTVAGNSYPIGSAAAKAKLSATGSFAVGDTVALLLGMDNEVVDVISAALVDGSYSGVITAAGPSSYPTGAGGAQTVYLLTVACTDGVERQCAVDSLAYYSLGTIVTISYLKGEQTVKKVSTTKLSGTVDSSGKKLGSLTLADGVEIMDISAGGDWMQLAPSRLAGAKLSQGDVLYYLQNSQNEITQLILNDVTGDLYSYGIVTSAKESVSQGEVTYTYQYQINGLAATHSTNSISTVSLGPALFRFSEGKLTRIENLQSVALTGLSALTATAGNKSYPLAAEVQVYRKSNSGGYELADIGTVHAESYSLTGYYETGFSAGGQLRVILANPI